MGRNVRIGDLLMMARRSGSLQYPIPALHVILAVAAIVGVWSNSPLPSVPYPFPSIILTHNQSPWLSLEFVQSVSSPGSMAHTAGRLVSNCTGIFFDGEIHPWRTSINTTAGIHRVQAPSCSTLLFNSWGSSTTGNTVANRTDNTTTLNLT